MMKTFVLMCLSIKKENEISRTRIKNLILDKKLKLIIKLLLILQKS